ncbi:uncharacterized protein LACBIDRAFT_316710 [Laccaria bicolor S238N-H82]|uniref:Predicted protein n=1 Tax=Laccaria bicolor (strain S238N-H82 / ATCC MYA-4686) TaxID=486041 RepID=B0E1H1_LACBS|nr:uncharacterized protein LACBIDRAFT_316710 [Laccaria bicolor S238N-H82]EDQ99308.1 predicted protein [Laccaria bicolor S238N-H82]|eukprot:XP_001890028.1 predicted protein [Laccaria bicolor S238N-H82]
MTPLSHLPFERRANFYEGSICPTKWSRSQMVVNATMSLMARIVSFRKGAKRKKQLTEWRKNEISTNLRPPQSTPPSCLQSRRLI